MAKPVKTTEDETPEQIDAPEQEAAEQEQPSKVTVAVPVTYIFRKNGTQRTFEVDEHHVKVMMNRNDLTYIGDIPLPKQPK